MWRLSKPKTGGFGNRSNCSHLEHKKENSVFVNMVSCCCRLEYVWCGSMIGNASLRNNRTVFSSSKSGK